MSVLDPLSMLGCLLNPEPAVTKASEWTAEVLPGPCRRDCSSGGAFRMIFNRWSRLPRSKVRLNQRLGSVGPWDVLCLWVFWRNSSVMIPGPCVYHHCWLVRPVLVLVLETAVLTVFLPAFLVLCVSFVREYVCLRGMHVWTIFFLVRLYCNCVSCLWLGNEILSQPHLPLLPQYSFEAVRAVRYSELLENGPEVSFILGLSDDQQ